MDALREAIRGKLNAFTGNSGVGKSSILNALDPAFSLPVGEVSKALGRGRHTTRHVEMFALGNDTYVIDTPGFSSFDTEELNLELKQHLPETFPEFAPFVDECRFVGCRHVKEKGCAVLQAVKDGKIPRGRHASYVRLAEELKNVNEWDKK
jgi:ribosome biogenesis GTPase